MWIMSKWVCTSSLFALLLGAGAVFIRVMTLTVPAYVWWLPEHHEDPDGIWVLWWVGVNVVLPVLVVLGASGVLLKIWELAKFCCGKWEK